MVVDCLDEARNNLLNIPGMNEGDKLDKLKMDFNGNVRVEVMKSENDLFQEVERIALKGESSPFRMGRYYGQTMATFRILSGASKIDLICDSDRNGGSRNVTSNKKNPCLGFVKMGYVVHENIWKTEERYYSTK